MPGLAVGGRCGARLVAGDGHRVETGGWAVSARGATTPAPATTPLVVDLRRLDRISVR